MNKQITKQQADDWAKGTSEDWANESHTLAVDVAYKDILADGPPPKIDQKYMDRAALAIEQQLERGGVRLAIILNKVLTK